MSVSEHSTRRWPLLVAAALLLACVGWLLATQLGSNDPGSRPVPPASTSSPAEADQMPSLLGYTPREARRELVGHGLTVTVRQTGTYCQPVGRVIGSTPPVGTHVEPGDKVTVKVSRAKYVIDCVGDPGLGIWNLAWHLVRFARGLGGPPRVAGHLVLHGPGDGTLSLTARQAADRDAWTTCGDEPSCDGVLEALARAAEQPAQVGDRFLPTSLSLGWGRACRAAGGPGIPRTRLSIFANVGGRRVCPGVQLFLRTEKGRLAEVWLVEADPTASSTSS